MCTDSTKSFIQTEQEEAFVLQSPEEDKAGGASLKVHLHFIFIYFAIRLCCIIFSFLDKLYNIQ